MKDNIYKGKEATDRIVSGIRRCAEAVGGTMGTAGHNAILECFEAPGHYTTNDGATILQAIHFEDPLEEMGRRILLEAVGRANKQSGDGSSTTTVLCAAIIEEGLKHLDEASPMDIKKSLEDCIPLIEASLEAQKRAVTVDTVGQVATISSEDEKIGALIQEIYQKIGKDGIIHWDISKTFDDHYTIGQGIVIEGAGVVSPYMTDIDQKTGSFTNLIRWKKSKVLLVKQKITSAAEFNDLFLSLFNREIKEVVVFCDEYEPNIIADLIQTRAVRGFRAVLIKMPTLWKDWWYEDIAKATGATVIDPALGVSLKTMNEKHLGQVENVVVSKESTWLDGLQDLTDYIKHLEADGTDDSKLRSSRLNTKTARYFVGAASDSALAYRRLKVEDALHSAYYALQDGVVAGGGVALAHIEGIPETVGGEILIQALKAPMKQIINNAGGEREPVVMYSIADASIMGFDTRTKKVVNMFEAGIVDTTSIVANACRNAISVAAAILTAPVVVLIPKETPAQAFLEELSRKNETLPVRS